MTFEVTTGQLCKLLPSWDYLNLLIIGFPENKTEFVLTILRDVSSEYLMISVTMVSQTDPRASIWITVT